MGWFRDDFANLTTTTAISGYRISGPPRHAPRILQVQSVRAADALVKNRWLDEAMNYNG